MLYMITTCEFTEVVMTHGTVTVFNMHLVQLEHK
jgi:hypothetical protein